MMDAHRIARFLEAKLEGDVGFDAGSRALYATDASNYRFVPIGVVYPRCVEDVMATVAICAEHDLPLLARGGGTSLAGQCTNSAVVLDFTRYMNRILAIDPREEWAIVEPGVVLDDLRAKAEDFGLTFGPDPATHNHCSLGGMIGNNSCGVHSVMAGRTSDNVLGLEVLTYDGLVLSVSSPSEEEIDRIVAKGGREADIYTGMRLIASEYGEEIRRRYPSIPRRVSGYALEQLLPENGFNVARALVGSEGTLVTVLKAKVRLVPSPSHRVLLLLGCADVFTAGDLVPEVLRFKPIALEGMDDNLVNDERRQNLGLNGIALLPEGRGWLIAEFGASTLEEAVAAARKAENHFKGIAKTSVISDKGQHAEIFKVRESGLGATARVPGRPDTWPGWEDSAVPVDRVGAYLREFRQLLDKHNYIGDLYGHFGDGCIHVRISFDLVTKRGRDRYREFLDEAADLVVAFGGSLSGEHGDGQARSALLEKMFGPRLLKAFHEFKKIWDPRERMNPGRIANPYPITGDLRLRDFSEEPIPTHFAYPDDKGSFARATTRCVGVGECRRESGGTMCPSYRVTREEMHSTRGRAHLLFEMMKSDVIAKGWQDQHVKEALDLCLACKGCKGECPVRVDVATYKAEFMAHYYANRLRPRSAFAMGLIPWWSRLGTAIPRFTNFVLHAPGSARLAKGLAGIAPERDMPRFATKNFRKSFRPRQMPKNSPRIILWTDTFTNYFEPHIAEAACEVLSKAGFAVTLTAKNLCCGRPLYDFGMLDRAKAWLINIMDELADEIEAGTPIVGLEPSCVAVFREELPALFPNDKRAARLAGMVKMFGEFLADAKQYHAPKIQKKAVLHGHCHQKAVLGMSGDMKLCKDMSLDFTYLDSGCCGMAGSFGFEKEKYEVSVKCGEAVLLPAVRACDQETIIITNGFSCREQIRQLTPRRALHLAEVIAMGKAA